MNDSKNQWDRVYKNTEVEELGWYEKTPQPSLNLINRYTKNKDQIILDAGCGQGTLLQFLQEEKYTHLIGLDISEEAIKISKQLLSNHSNGEILFEVADLGEKINSKLKVNIWHDRAVFHFLQSELEIENYITNAYNFLSGGGYLILAVFSNKEKAEFCNGLAVKKYSQEELKKIFKDYFQLIESFEFDYIMPWGDKRIFLYAVFKKIES